MASAEERQLGVSEWQLLLPMPARLQWIVKAAVTLGLTGVLVLRLPAVLGLVDGSSRLVHEAETAALVIGAVVMLSTFSLYVSSLCSSGVGALVFTIPAAVAGCCSCGTPHGCSTNLRRRCGSGCRCRVWARSRSSSRSPCSCSSHPSCWRHSCCGSPPSNHRSADHRGGRVWKQAIAIGGFVTAALLVLAVFVAASRA